MSQVIAFAKSQVILADSATPTIIYTDPVPLGNFDRGTADLVVAYLFNTTSPGLSYVAQVSNDGTNWVDSALTDSKNAAGLASMTAAVLGAFIRFKVSLKGTNSVIAACSFDLHVLLDHA